MIGLLALDVGIKRSGTQKLVATHVANVVRSS